MRESLLETLANRPEEAAFDKVAWIARGDRDKSLRTVAIQALSASKNPKAAAVLAEIVNPL